MNDDLRSIVASVVVLGLAALLALYLAIARTPATDPNPKSQRRLIGLAVLAISVQCAHFVEELLTGFQERFPTMLGLPPMPGTFFVAFNVSWIAVWMLSVWGLARRIRAAFFPIWFLGIAGAINGLAHPLMAIGEWSYFPGLWTSPLIGVAGVLLLRGLASFTVPVVGPRKA